MSVKVEIWFEFASTYSYLGVSRAADLLQGAGLAFEWKPFLLGPVFRKKGWASSPFVLDGIKGAYMWRDMERRAARYGLPFVKPLTFPAHSLLAARVMTAVLEEAWCGDFAREVFVAQFARGEDIADPQTLTRALKRHTSDPSHWLEQAGTDRIREKLRSLTDTAETLGIFGAPSFRVGDELFWGDDRLEDAIAWALDTRI